MRPGRPSGDAQIWECLRAGARLACSETDLARLAQAAAQVTDWSMLPREADAHGIAPLLLRNLRAAAVAVPRETEAELAVLSTRYRAAGARWTAALLDALEALDSAAIPVIVLKGAALAQVLYRDGSLRPLGDLDLLVPRDAVDAAQHALASVGFRSSPRRGHGDHHHLPALSRTDGTTVELHVDALTPDSRASLSFDAAERPLQSFVVGDRAASTFGHQDMLYHLCRHAAECSTRLRLIWVADILDYATAFAPAIDWPALGRHRPFVLNALSLLHLVVPLPEPLRLHVVPAARQMRGVGLSCTPLAEIARRENGVASACRDLLAPPEWWVRFYHGVDASASLAWHRTVVHPWRVAGWLARRADNMLRRRLAPDARAPRKTGRG